MIYRLLFADWIKIRRTWLVWLVLLGPFCMILAQSVNYGIRYDDLKPFGWLAKDGLLYWVHALLPLTVALGAAIMASLIAGIEHDAKSWKQLFVFPVSRIQIFASKAIWLAFCMFVCVILTIVSIAVFGYFLLGGPIPWLKTIQTIVYPYLAVYPILLLQLWLSMIIKNQTLPITIGIIGSILGQFFATSENHLFHYFIWAYPGLANIFNTKSDPLTWVWMGVSIGLGLLIIGSIHFSKKEVH